MSELGKQDKKITTTESPKPEPMDLVKAKLVLETIVKTHEDSFTENSDLNMIGTYNTDQIREALQLVSQNILDTHEHQDGVFITKKTTKPTTEGNLSLTVFRQSEKDSNAQSISLSLVSNGKYILQSQIPLETDDLWKDSVKFSDSRKSVKITSQNSQSMNTFRNTYRGMRWLSANMLSWDGELQLPEDLDKTIPAK